ncbi:DNA polymerase I [Deltaproteobacteria bacterium OttesenSCG-928-K17]|nr:DNA polymerase I [Deltaproteobacteria bacterium OttesenSCG-928-K17]
MTDSGPVYLMDASAFIHRAFHAIRNLTTKSGQPTGAVYGFTSTLLKLLKEKKPKALAVVFDSRGPGRRHQLYPEYKANRGPMDEDLAAQQEPIRRIVAALGLYGLEKPGFEADDLIAAGARFFENKNQKVVIVSGDKDFYQLLSSRVSMYDPDPKKESALTREAFKERFGLEPDAFLDMQALMGDSSDNIPGVPKVGEKTAQKLMVKFGSLDKIYENLDEVTPEKLRDNLAAHKDSAYLSRELASLGQGAEVDFTLDDLRPAPPDVARLVDIFNELEFSRLIKEIMPDGEAAPAPAPAAPDQDPVLYDDYVLVNSDQTWADLMNALAKAEVLSVDLETDCPSPSSCSLVGMSLCAGPGRAFYIPIDHRTLGAANQKWEMVSEKIGPYLIKPDLPKIGQNAKFDWLILARYGLDLPDPSDDPMLASYLLDPESRHGMDHLSARYLGHQPIAFKEMVPDPKKNFGDIAPEDALDYAAEDADVTLRLAGLLRERLAEDDALLALYEQVELPLEGLLARMERTGVLIDAEALGALSTEFSAQQRAMESRIYELAGRPFNIGSPKQLSDVLFGDLGLTPVKKTAKKTAYSTDDEVLAELALLHDLPKEIREWRSLDKLRGTYTDKLPKAVNPETGRVHTSYNQTLTATGRLSSSDPNLQNIPAKGEVGRRIRAAFIAPEGFAVMAADYSQIELRVLAHFSQDESLLKAFANDEDIHTQTAAEIFGVPPSEVTPTLRREAKTINFGVVYGQGPFALGKQLGIPQAQARDFIERYFARFPGVRRYMEETREQARADGFVTTWFGRRRWLRGLTGGYQARQEAERMAINTPIQGTAADLIKMAMLKVDGRLKAEHPQARLVMQVHDELVLEVPQAEVAAVSELLRAEMSAVAQNPPLTGARPLSAVLKVDVGFGPNWAEAH